MAYFAENLGLDFVSKDNEDRKKLQLLILHKGKWIKGYIDGICANYHMGDAQFVLSAIYDKEKDAYRVQNVDTHIAGICEWNVLLSDINLNDEEENSLKRRCIVRDSETGEKFTVCEILNADVLPSYLEDEPVALQMAAFPLEFEYITSEEEFLKTGIERTEDLNFSAKMGKIVPDGLLKNFLSDDEEKRYKLGPQNSPVTLAGKVKSVQKGFIRFGEDDEEYIGFAGVIIDTDFGELQIVHSIPQLDEREIYEIKPGHVVFGRFILSADAAINEYENGRIFDEEHNLMALRHILQSEETERCANLFAEDVTYISQSNATVHKGKQAVISALDSINQKLKYGCIAHLATIDDHFEYSSMMMKYPIGTRCLAIEYIRKDENAETFRYEMSTLIFIENDDEGKICKIEALDSDGYIFILDEDIQDYCIDDTARTEEDETKKYSRGKQRGKVFSLLSDTDLSSEMIKKVSEHLGSFKENIKIEMEAERLYNIFTDLTDEEIEKAILSLEETDTE